MIQSQLFLLIFTSLNLVFGKNQAINLADSHLIVPFSYRHLSRQYAKVANLAYVLFQSNIPNCSNGTSGLFFYVPHLRINL